MMRLLILATGILAGVAGMSQADGGQLMAQEGARWTFFGSAGTELWFHGMALVDPQGPGASPLYDLNYPHRVREAKEAAGVGTTPLDGSVGRFREAFRRDPAFEVFHFLPLYFAGAGRVEMFGALKTLATRSSGIPQSSTPQAAVGLAVVGSVLQTPDQRALLGEFIAALEAEWTTYLSVDFRSRAPASEALGREVQKVWDERFGPALGPFLESVGLAGGSVILTPALGLEGRVYAGTPQSWRDNVVSVQTPSDPQQIETSIYLLLRELAFPVAREAGRQAGVGGEGIEEEALVAKGAVRVSAMLLEDVLPQEAEEFKKFYLEKGGYRVPVDGIGAAFQEAFALDSAYLEALQEAIEVN
jgi:hypothetical protein